MSGKKNKESISAINAKDDYIVEIQKVFDKQKDLKPQEKVNTVDEVKKKWKMNDRILELFSNNIERDQRLRETYAKILIGILSVELVALIVIFVLKGAEVLNYSDTTFNIFVSGGIAEVFILVKVIVEYLFKDNLTNALNIILENNNQVKYKKNNKYNSKNKEN